VTVDIDVLIPTYQRPTELAACLAGLAAQDHLSFGVTISDQSDGGSDFDTPVARTLLRVLELHGHPIQTVRNLPRLGVAQQRAFLLSQSSAPYVLLLDDDVWLESWAITRLHTAITELQCGFVGFAVQGLSYLKDERPHELEPFELWQGRPEPEELSEETTAFRRWTLHNAANPTHLGQRLGLERGEWRAYKVAWIGGCTLFHRETLLDCGGFDFWTQLPPEHAGEDVVAQWRVMARSGGAGILPSGAVHLESPTTVVNRQFEARRVLSN
jgi:GT2 family glycosyltransferase